MYESYFGLKEKPFNLSPDPSFLYMSPGHENVYSHLEYAVRENKGFAVITGEVGSGKTTLINYLAQKLGQDYKIGIINNTDISTDQLLQMIAMEFGLPISPLGDRAAQLNAWASFLVEQGTKGQKVIIIIDEAQNLPLPTLEGLRMLSNLEGDKEPLMQIILVGQPELREKLKTQELRQLSQRVTVHTHLESLSATDVYNYIIHRLKVAQAQQPEEIFTAGAINQVARYSKGLPRIINYLCDTAMVYAFADELKNIGEETIASVVATRQIGGLMPDMETSPANSAVEITPEGPKPVGTDFYKASELSSRVSVLEEKIARLETFLAARDKNEQQYRELYDNIHKRDTIILELLKMLGENITGRQNALTKLYSAYKARKVEPPQSGDAPANSNPAIFRASPPVKPLVNVNEIKPARPLAESPSFLVEPETNPIANPIANRENPEKMVEKPQSFFSRFTSRKK